ncbi:GNAT family N-acetyltransferase [Treponema sp. OMZ 305]|uniref:GNAT family N-acetyltransferase n=1 Tax=Treponema sp. OMZ 305 TaxID=1659192 RepID=UPI0020A2B6DA|nr:GNAT family N-acetyltransferase [Treponema sp. OMZ 305]UTC58634.1 GNAT family N-acetyltransferase [Treponema sp. OMZ 305]
MTFILSPEIIDDIIFSMENQDQILSFDALEGICVDMDEIDDDYETTIDDQRYYDLPEWTSAQGFRVMEQFTTRVHNPLLREALLNALGQRKGVFRRYKEVLKTAPTVEREWYRFKDQQMKAAVYEWYNELRMIWGLEKIGFEDETDPQLLQEDFIFQIEKHDALNRELLQNFIRKTEETSDDGDKIISFDDFDEKAALEAGRLLGYASFFNADVCAAAGRQYGTAQNHAAYITAYNENGLCGLCSVIAFPFNESFCIPFLRVLPEYRGLGLGKALLQRACVYSAPLAATLLFADFCTPSHFITELERNGFKRMGLLYVKDLSIEE